MIRSKLIYRQKINENKHILENVDFVVNISGYCWDKFQELKIRK